MTRNCLYRSADHIAYHQRPDRPIQPGPDEGDCHAKSIRPKVDHCRLTDAQVAIRRGELCRTQSGDDADESDYAEQLGKHRLAVEGRHRLRKQQNYDTRQHAPNDFQGPCRVYECGLIASLVMNDGLFDSDVGKQGHAYQHGLNDRHQSERFRKEQSGEYQVAPETKQLARPKTKYRPAACAQYAMHEL